MSALPVVAAFVWYCFLGSHFELVGRMTPLAGQKYDFSFLNLELAGDKLPKALRIST